jgi:hypothetical protein
VAIQTLKLENEGWNAITKCLNPANPNLRSRKGNLP